MLRAVLGILMGVAASAHAQGPVLEAEVLERSARVELLDGASSAFSYLILHHKHRNDQDRLAAWLRTHDGARVAFETADGAVHAAVLRRLKHCFGRGLLIYADSVELREKDSIRLRLDGSN